MITYFMFKQFKESGEFDEEKNPFANIEILFRLPFFIFLDVLLIIKLIELFNIV